MFTVQIKHRKRKGRVSQKQNSKRSRVRAWLNVTEWKKDLMN
jgi:hypothetical protein